MSSSFNAAEAAAAVAAAAGNSPAVAGAFSSSLADLQEAKKFIAEMLRDPEAVAAVQKLANSNGSSSFGVASAAAGATASSDSGDSSKSKH